MNFDNLTDSNILEIIFNPELNKESKLRILGKKFVNNNKNKCKIIFNNKEYELKEYLDDIDKNYNDKNSISMNLMLNNDITNISYMFAYCKTLIKINNISKFNTSKVINMNNIFTGCS